MPHQPDARLMQAGRLRLVTQRLEHSLRLREFASRNGHSGAEACGSSHRCVNGRLAIDQQLRKHAAPGWRSPQERLTGRHPGASAKGAGVASLLRLRRPDLSRIVVSFPHLGMP